MDNNNKKKNQLLLLSAINLMRLLGKRMNRLKEKKRH